MLPRVKMHVHALSIVLINVQLLPFYTHDSFMYCIVKNFGGEKTLTNLANRHNSPSFFCQFLLCSVWCSQPFMRPLNNKRGASPVRMKTEAALHSLSITVWIYLFYTRDNHGS